MYFNILLAVFNVGEQQLHNLGSSSFASAHNSHMVGSYYSLNGRFMGLGPWRSSEDKICNAHGGGCVVLHPVTRADKSGAVFLSYVSQ